LVHNLKEENMSYTFPTPPLTDGQLFIGSSGQFPVAALLTSLDSSVVITPGPGSLDLSVTGGTVGPGTPDTIAKFTGAGTTVGDSRITDNGTDIVLDSGTGSSSATGLIGGLPAQAFGVDYGNDLYWLGDKDQIGNATFIKIDNANNRIDIDAGGFPAYRATLGGGGLLVALGDLDSVGNDTLLSVDDGNMKIGLAASGEIDLDSRSGATKIGDVNGAGNATLLVVDDSAKEVLLNVPMRLAGYTVATLPGGVMGDTAFVTDALLPSFLVPVVGGGAVVTPVFFDGTNWVAH
jgi:hypothetical protein